MEQSFKPLSALGAIAASAESVECQVHGAFMQSTYTLGGVERKSRCPSCERERDAERSKEALAQADAERRVAKEARAAGRAAEVLSTSKLPKRFIGRTFDTYVAETNEQRGALTTCREFAEHFSEHLESGHGLLLTGQKGCGKTHLAGAIMQHIMPRYTSLYTTVPELVRAVRDTWRRDSKHSTSAVIDAMRALDLFVLDEVGMQTGTDGEQVILYDVLDGRYRDCKPTILLTNLDAVAMKAAIGDRLFDRLRETSRRVLFDWDSYRLKARSA